MLKGAQALLANDDGPVLLLEFNATSLAACGTTVLELRRYLLAASYECFALEQLREGPDPVWNVLALKPSHIRAHQLREEFGVPRFDHNYD